MRIPKHVRHLSEIGLASCLFGVAGFLAGDSQWGWAIAVGLLALPVARVFGIVVIDRLDFWMRRRSLSLL